MGDAESLRPSQVDELFLRRSFEVARGSTTRGNHPFGAMLVDQNGNVLIEAENGFMPDHDSTAHAERLLARQACRTLAGEVRAKATLYSSAEPCAMCAGAIYWAGIGPVVYGLSEHRLRGVTVNHPENPSLDLPCRDVFKPVQHATEVVGPVLEDEAQRCTEAFGTDRPFFRTRKHHCNIRAPGPHALAVRGNITRLFDAPRPLSRRFGRIAGHHSNQNCAKSPATK